MLPHQVEILYDFEGAENATVCAGTIISSYLVLTVATCLAGRNESLFKIKANGKNQNESQIRTIDQVFSYAALDSEASPFDVAVISLNSELELDKNPTSEIRYARSQILLYENFSDEALVCREDGSSKVATVASSGCSQNSKGKTGEEGNFICIESFENVTESSQLPQMLPLPLAGRSLICSGVLFGLFATNSSTDGKRAYTSVAQYSHWIELVVDAEEEADDENDLDLGANVLKWLGNEPVVPYQLSIRLNGSHHCGGVILDKRTALSAAHCFDPKESGVASFNLSSFLLVAGEQNLNESDSTKQIFQIDKFFKHPEYKNVLEGNDIAVILIKGEFNFTDRVNNVWISSQNSPNFQDDNGTATTPATGWKKTRIYGQLSPVLLSVDLELLEKGRCKKKWPFLTDPMICGYNNISNICKGDSGGPLVIQNYEHGHGHGPHTKKDLLVGIASFGPIECEKRNMPNGFTNVSSFYAWISETRANSLCSSSQFQCFNGDCILKEMRRDKKFDCADGSDEKMCSSHSRVTAPCGGFINLAQSPEKEIIYKVPSEEDSICLWLVSTGRKDAGASIEATILNNPSAQFNPSSDVILSEFGFTIDNSQYEIINKTGAKYTVGGSFMTLYYRTNSSAPNAGFHLKLKDSSSKSNMTERLNVKLITLSNANLEEGETREFSYPPPPASEYENNERTFIIVKPRTRHGKLKLKMKYVSTEEKEDWVEISSVKKSRPTTEFSFSGSTSLFWYLFYERGFKAEAGEPFIIYFHSNENTTKSGFKFSMTTQIRK